MTRVGFHDNCAAAVAMAAPEAADAGLMRAALQLVHQSLALNSGTSAALGLSKTGLVGVGRGVEEVIVLVVMVEVVRSRYH